MKRLWIAAALVALGCQAEDESVTDVNSSGGVAEEGGGNPYDQVNPGLYEHVDPGKADTPAYTVPEFLPRLVDPKVVVSLAGFSVELIDEATGFHKVYPTGVGALGRSGRSFTPVGEFATGPDPSDNWWYYARRYRPEYFAGLPFLRLTAKNHRGYATYGFHGPITETLIRGYVSHGCMRMRGDDIVELFTMLKPHPSTPVSIQAEKRFTEGGELVDVTPPELDPVKAYQAMVAECEDEERDPEEALPAGEYTGFGLCGRDDVFRIKVEAGDKVVVSASSKEGPVELVLNQGDAGESAVATEVDGTWQASVSLRAGEAGEIELSVVGDLVQYDLSVTLEPFEGDSEG